MPRRASQGNVRHSADAFFSESGGELIVALAVRQDEAAHSPERRVPGGQRKQEQPADRVVDDHRGVVDV
jgi:hypothetical protein